MIFFFKFYDPFFLRERENGARTYSFYISVGCEISRVFGYFVIFLVKNIVEISF